MTYHVITKNSKFVMKSKRYKLIEQAITISKRFFPYIPPSLHRSISSISSLSFSYTRSGQIEAIEMSLK